MAEKNTEKFEVLVPDNMRVEKREVPAEPERNPSGAPSGPPAGDQPEVGQIAEGAKQFRDEKDLDGKQLDGAILAVTAVDYWVPEKEAVDASANPLAKMVRDRPWRAESEGSGTSENAPDSADKQAASGKK